MTEEEKALAGYLYLAKEEELQKERERSRGCCLFFFPFSRYRIA